MIAILQYIAQQATHVQYSGKILTKHSNRTYRNKIFDTSLNINLMPIQ